VAITSREGALVVTTLHYSEEILDDDDFSPKKGKIAAEEQSRIKENIEHMIEDFDPGKYADERRKKLLDLLARKAKEKTAVEAPAGEEEEGKGPADLVAALEESMRQVKEHR
jgi:DNA end-binding protein Ku